MNICIKDIAYYLPEKVLTNEELEKEYDKWDSEKIFNKIGIKCRHIASDNDTAVDLAEKASIQLFNRNPDLRNKIDFMMLCTQSPDYLIPTSACILQDRLGIPKTCGALDYNLGCSGFIYGLALSKGLIATGIANNVLLLTSETYTKHIHPKDMSTRTIFGDGAAAIWICKSSDGGSIDEFVLGSDGSGAQNLIIPSGGLKLSRSNETAREYVDENGNIRSKDNLYMNGSEVFSFTINVVPKLVEQTLIKNNLEMSDIDYFIFHQANKYMLDYLRKKINIPEEKFYLDMETTGNTVSSTIPIAVSQALNKGFIKKGSKLMLVGFGVGYSWGACVVSL